MLMARLCHCASCSWDPPPTPGPAPAPAPPLSGADHSNPDF